MDMVTGVCEKNAHLLNGLTSIMPPAPPKFNVGCHAGGESQPAKKTPISRASSTRLEASTLNFGVRGDSLTHNSDVRMGVFFADTGIKSSLAWDVWHVLRT